MPYSYSHAHPAVATDIVVFTVENSALKVLLIQRNSQPFQDHWALPGGFVRIDESLDSCAKRKLTEETDLSDLYLEQLYTFGAVDRDPRERVISVAYYALIPIHLAALRSGAGADDAAWFALDALPELGFDHGEIIRQARERLAAKLDYSTLGLKLMPETFTLSELQQIYEIVSGHPKDKRNFRKWVLSLEVLEETGEKKAEGPHRPAMLYRLTDKFDVTNIK